MKLRSLSEVEAHLNEAFSWRRRELTTVRLNLKASRDHEKALWFRAGVVLLYAHWEGFIKACAKAYLNYIVKQGPSYMDLKPCFRYFAVSDSLDSSRSVNLKNFILYAKAEMFFKGPLLSKFQIDPGPYISTRENQNLTAEEFKSIVQKVGIDYLHTYALREKLIDEQLLNYRNKVAHGESTSHEVEDEVATFEVLAEKIINCMELFRDQVFEAVKNKTFLLVAHP